MVSKGEAALVVGIVGAFGLLGGFSLIRPAITNVKQTKQSLSSKINEIREKNKNV